LALLETKRRGHPLRGGLKTTEKTNTKKPRYVKGAGEKGSSAQKSLVELRWLFRVSGGKKGGPSYKERGIEVGSDWTCTEIGGPKAEDHAKGGCFTPAFACANVRSVSYTQEKCLRRS